MQSSGECHAWGRGQPKVKDCVRFPEVVQESKWGAGRLGMQQMRQVRDDERRKGDGTGKQTELIDIRGPGVDLSWVWAVQRAWHARA